MASGIIAQHRAVLNQLIQGYPMHYEASVLKKTNGKKYWHYENNFPNVGVHASLTDFANPSQLGYAISLAPCVEIPLREKKSTLHLRLCWGFSWITKKFDIYKNQKNIAIGSHGNAYIQFRWFWKIPLGKNLIWEPSFMAMHVSNARFQSPNLGLNILSIQQCLQFSRDNQTSLESKTFQPPVFGRKEFLMVQTIGWNDYEVYGKKLFSLGTNFQFHFLNKPKHRWMMGADIYYDQNYIQDVRVYSSLAPTNVWMLLRFGPKIGYAYNMGRISFPIEMGYYVYQLRQADGLFFHRIGMRYYHPSGWVINATLRSHFAVAYCFEIGAGYHFRWNKR